VNVSTIERVAPASRARTDEPLELEKTGAEFADSLAAARELEETPETVPPPAGVAYPPLEIEGQPIVRVEGFALAPPPDPTLAEGTGPGRSLPHPAGGKGADPLPPPGAFGMSGEEPAPAEAPLLGPAAGAPAEAHRISATGGAPGWAERGEEPAPAIQPAASPIEPEGAEDPEITPAEAARIIDEDSAVSRAHPVAVTRAEAPDAARVEPEAVPHVAAGADPAPQSHQGETGGEPPPRPAPPPEDEAHPAGKWSLLRAAGGESRARATVNHPTLGALQLDFTLEEGAVDVRVLAPSLVAAIQLERDVDAIRALLREHGHRLSDLRVQVAGFDDREATGTHPIQPRRPGDGRLSLTA